MMNSITVLLGGGLSGSAAQISVIKSKTNLKEHYEIVGESHPLSGFFSPTHADCLQKCISNHETKQSSTSFREIRALIASQSTFEI